MGRIFWARNGYRYRPDTELREVLWRTLIYKHAWWKFSFRQFEVAEQKVLIEFYVASVSYSEISTYGKSTYNAVCDFPLAIETIIALIRSQWLTVCVLYFWSCSASFFNLSLIERLKQRGPLGGARMGGAMEWHVSFSPFKILFFPPSSLNWFVEVPLNSRDIPFSLKLIPKYFLLSWNMWSFYLVSPDPWKAPGPSSVSVRLPHC